MPLALRTELKLNITLRIQSSVGCELRLGAARRGEPQNAILRMLLPLASYTEQEQVNILGVQPSMCPSRSSLHAQQNIISCQSNQKNSVSELFNVLQLSKGTSYHTSGLANDRFSLVLKTANDSKTEPFCKMPATWLGWGRTYVDDKCVWQAGHGAPLLLEQHLQTCIQQ